MIDDSVLLRYVSQTIKMDNSSVTLKKISAHGPSGGTLLGNFEAVVKAAIKTNLGRGLLRICPRDHETFIMPHASQQLALEWH
jgi:hypothetical protein